MALSWEQSGSGAELPITLQAAQLLAVESGFVFKNAQGSDGLPLARHADLQGEARAARAGGAHVAPPRSASVIASPLKGACAAAPPAAMFEHFGVNSLSAFRHKFRHYELRPHGSGSGAGNAGTAAGQGSAPLLGGPGSSSSSSRNRWQVQQRDGETYVGELLDGRPHGGGILLSKARLQRKRATSARGCWPAAHYCSGCPLLLLLQQGALWVTPWQQSRRLTVQLRSLSCPLFAGRWRLGAACGAVE